MMKESPKEDPTYAPMRTCSAQKKEKWKIPVLTRNPLFVVTDNAFRKEEVMNVHARRDTCLMKLKRHVLIKTSARKTLTIVTRMLSVGILSDHFRAHATKATLEMVKLAET